MRAALRRMGAGRDEGFNPELSEKRRAPEMRMPRALLDVADVMHDVLFLVLVTDVAEPHLEAAGAAPHRVAMRDATDALAEAPPAFRAADADLQVSH